MTYFESFQPRKTLANSRKLLRSWEQKDQTKKNIHQIK